MPFTLTIEMLFWALGVVFLLLSLVVLIEISRSNRRREVGKMFASEKFEEKIAQFNLTAGEKLLLDRLVRQSSFSNKDSVLNSPLLFERAVNHTYKLNHGVERIAVADKVTISALRKKLGHLENAAKFSYISTRQFAIGQEITLILRDVTGQNFSLRRNIVNATEDSLEVPVEEFRSDKPLVGTDVKIRLNIPGEAVYSADVRIIDVKNGNLVLSHSTEIHKEQLRRWLRQVVRFPVHVELGERSIEGFLVDLSAGGILLSLPGALPENFLVKIRFDLPGFGEENLQVRILRVLHGGRMNESTGGIHHSASFIGDFSETQEHILQYIFRKRRLEKEAAA